MTTRSILATAVCLGLGGLCPGGEPGPAPENLLPNGGFESGNTEGWQGGGTASREEAHSGDWSLRVTNGSPHAEIKTEIGARYKVLGWVKIVSSEGADWGGMRVQAVDADSKSLAHSDWLNLGSHGKEWFKVAIGFQATTPKTTLNVGFFGGPKKKMVAHFDDLRVFRRDGPNAAPQIEPRLSPVAFEQLPAQQVFELRGDDPDGGIRRVFWDFGDGQRSFDFSGQRRVGLPGRYTATVTAVDDEGAVTRQSIAWSASDGGLPTVAVRTPAAAETTVAEPVAHLEGTAAGAIRQVLVSGDLRWVVTAKGTSQWKADVPLQPGYNRLLVQAHDEQGRVCADQRMVRYVPPGRLEITDLRGGGQAGTLTLRSGGQQVEQWEVLTLRFQLRNSGATHPQFPYDPSPAPGLSWVDGASVDGVFTSEDGQTVCRRPAFLYQDYERELKAERPKGKGPQAKPAAAKVAPPDDLKGKQQWDYPRGAPEWMIRFAPPRRGKWRCVVEAREAKAEARSEPLGFEVTAPTDPRNHGPVQLAKADTRYFEYADGTPFLGTGHAFSPKAETFFYDALRQFEEMGRGNQQMFRWWISGQVWGSAWFGWISRTLGYDGITPVTGLSVERGYGDGLASFRLVPRHPIVWQGFMTGHAGLIPGRNYCLRVRWRTEGITKPEQPGEPFGAAVKFIGWPDPGKTGSAPAVVAHVHGDTPWHVAEGRFQAQSDFIPNVILVLENTETGAAYVDQCGVYEVGDDGQLGPQLLRSSHADAHLHFEQARGHAIDAIFQEAQARGMCFKLVISEKAEFLLNRFAPEGVPDRRLGHFSDGDGSPVRRLHEYYWRHVFARYGAFRALHSWETVNEDRPDFGGHFRLAAALAKAAAADGNPHPATLSTWATLAEAAWKHPDSAPISYVDFHAYIRSTGWLEPKGELADDSARFMAEYDRAGRAAGFGKPVVWGEVGIDGESPPDKFKKDAPADSDGVWLHKLAWARCGPGGVYPVCWYIDNIFRHKLHHHFGAWNRFMEGIPLTNGRYRDAEAQTSHADLRTLGQKDLQAGRAHVWIDNRNHTWKAVVDGRQVSPLSGSVTIDMEKPRAAYDLTWYDTATGKPTRTLPVAADASGRITVTVDDLKTDTAVRLAPR